MGICLHGILNSYKGYLAHGTLVTRGGHKGCIGNHLIALRTPHTHQRVDIVYLREEGKGQLLGKLGICYTARPEGKLMCIDHPRVGNMASTYLQLADLLLIEVLSKGVVLTLPVSNLA